MRISDWSSDVCSSDLQFVLLVEIHAELNAETFAKRRRDQTGPRRGAHQREGRQVDADGSRRRSLADNEIELKILHRRIEDFLHRRVDRKRVVEGKSVSVRVDLGCRRINKKKKEKILR